MALKKLLALGGNRYNVLSIRAAKAMGFFVIVADRNPQASGLAEADVGLPVDLYDYDTLINAINQHGGVDGIVSMAEAGVQPAAHLSHLLGLSSITEEAAKNATSKALMRQLWKRYSVDFRVVNGEDEAVRAVRELDRFPLIFKPDRSLGGSRGVIRVDDPADVIPAFRFAQSGGLSGSSVVIETFVRSNTEHSAEVLIWEGRASVLCVGQKVKSTPPYRVDVSVQYPALLSPEQETETAELCQYAVSALGLICGVAHVEFAWTEEGPVLFELGARCGGGHTPQIADHVSGVNEFIEVCRMACGMSPEQFTPVVQRGADYRFLVYPPGVLAEIIVPDAVKLHPGVLDVDITFVSGHAIEPLHTTSQRAGFVITTAETHQAAVALADWACQQILVHYQDGSIAHAYLPEDFEQVNPVNEL